MIYALCATFVGAIAVRQLVRIRRARRAHDLEVAQRFRLFQGRL